MPIGESLSLAMGDLEGACTDMRLHRIQDGSCGKRDEATPFGRGLGIGFACEAAKCEVHHVQAP